MYTRKLWGPTESEKKVPLDFDTLIAIYVLRDARLAPGLKNAAIDALIDIIADEWEFSIKKVEYIYKNTPKSSPLGRLVVDVVAPTTDVKGLEKRLDDCPREYLYDLLVTTSSLEDWTTPSPEH